MVSYLLVLVLVFVFEVGLAGVVLLCCGRRCVHDYCSVDGFLVFGALAAIIVRGRYLVWCMDGSV